MGRLIEEKCYLYGSCKCQTAGCIVRPDNGCPVYRYFKNLIVKDYENRLKADMVAMLEEISLEIEEKTKDPALDDYDCGFNTGVYVSRDIIQQKIDKLKEK